MPEAVRREYEQAIAQFEDANKNGIPDVLENASKNVVMIQHSSFTINGKTFESAADLPPWAKTLIHGAVGGAPPGEEADLQIEPIETTTDVLAGIVRALLVASAIAVVVLATLMFRNMDESSASQGGRVWVVVGAVIVLAVIADRYFKMSRR
jgi:hypothetical protein